MSINAFGQSNTNKANSANIDTSAFLKVDGTRQMQGILDMNQNKIANIQTPSASGDVATKGYADTKLSASGGTILGSLTIDPFYEITQSKAPSAVDSLTNKNYVDTSLNLKASKVYVDDVAATKLGLAGGTMVGNLNMNSYRITNLVNRTGTQEAACKSYVDNQDATKLSLTGGTMTGNLVLTSPAYIQQEAVPAAASTLCNKSYVDGKLALTGGTMTGNITMGSTVEVLNPKAPSTANSVCNKTYVDKMLPLAGGSLTGNLTMSGTTEVIQATAPSTGNSLCNKTYVDNAVAGKVSKTGYLTGNLSLTNSAEVIQAQAPTTVNSLCNKTYVDDLFTTGTKASDMLVSIGTSASRAIGCTGVASRPTVAGDSKNVILSLGNPAISCVSSSIGNTPQESYLTLLSPGKTSFVNCVSSDSLPTEVAKIEAVTVNGATKGLVTVNGDVDLGSYSTTEYLTLQIRLTLMI